MNSSYNIYRLSGLRTQTVNNTSAINSLSLLKLACVLITTFRALIIIMYYTTYIRARDTICARKFSSPQLAFV